MKRNDWISALKASLTLDNAQSFILRQNEREPKRKDNNKLRPVISWTHVVKLTLEQKDAIARMCGFEGHTGFGWNILSLAWSFEEQVYAVVCKNETGMYAVVYPNGEVDKHTSALTQDGMPMTFIFRAVGDWTLNKNAYTPVKRVASTEPLPSIPVERAVDNFQSANVRISGMYHRGFMHLD